MLSDVVELCVENMYNNSEKQYNWRNYLESNIRMRQVFSEIDCGRQKR